MKLWGGRFTKETNQLVHNFNESLSFDQKFYQQDIQGSIAHVTMLAKQGILTETERDTIIIALNQIRVDIASGALVFDEAQEDIHSFVESVLISRIGDTGKKLHTGRSRNDQVALDIILDAIADAGYEAGTDFMISLDVAASEWKNEKRGQYFLKKQGLEMTTKELILHYESLVAKYPILSLEDPLDEEDWEGWKEITKRLGDKVYLVGDDLFVTNEERLTKGITEKAGNAILIKPNQIGSLTETMDTVRLAKEHGFITIMSHRSGETEDTTIADLAVGLGTSFVKMGAPCRGERTAKYNRLLRIEEELQL